MDKYTEISLSTLRKSNVYQLRKTCKDGKDVIVKARGYGRILIIKYIGPVTVPVSPGAFVNWSEFRSANVSTLLDWRKPIVVLLYGRPAFAVRRWSDGDK